MDDSGVPKDDVKVPDGDVGDKIKKMFHDEGKDVSVTVMSAMGEEVAVEAKGA
jgi:translation initiation factor 5A